jgi:prepilin-type N-terminal cleavage/methylation domain-containing protein
VTKRLRSESGYTLTEVLVAVVILAVGVGALLAAMSSMILGSTVHSNLVTTDALTRAYAEQLLSSATQVPTCALPSDYPAATNVPVGYVARVTNVEYGDGLNPTGYNITRTQCTETASYEGVQRVTIEAHFGAPGSTTGQGQQYLQIVKRQP